MWERGDDDEDASAEPLWLGDGADASLILVHRPQLASHTAVLITPPFGWSEVCSYRDRRDWAAAFAAAGFLAARVTLPGTGDSGGGPGDAELGARWLRSIAGAAAWLRAEGGARRVAVVGIGLGGLLACAAAEAGAGIDDFILWGVVARGAALVRQEQAYAGVIMSISDQMEYERVLADGSLQLTGYRIGAPTATWLRDLELDPRRIPGVDTARVLLIDRDGLPVDPKLERGFREAGAEVDNLGSNDWVEFISPAEEKRPEKLATIIPTVAWLNRADAVRQTPRATGAPEVGAAAEVLVAPGVRERVLNLNGPLAGAFAVVSEPAAGVDPLPATAIFLHAYHTGPGRMWVELARRWAARGLTVVRADLPGLHESPGASPRRVDNNFLYREESIAQTKALVEAVRRDGLPPRVILGGFCAGSYWALHAAVGDPLVSDLMLVNLWIVRWEAKVVAERMAVERAGNLRQRVVRRLRSRELTLAEMRLSVRKVMHERRSVGRPAERAQNRELVHILDRLAEQGTDMALLFTEREALLEQMRRAGLLDRLDDFARLHVDELRVVDHNLWAVSVQASVHAALDQALERALERPFAGTLVPGAAH